MATTPTDSRLISSVQAGDRRALSALYERHAGHMLALALQLLRDVAAAEDLVHDVFVELWQRAHQYSPERGSVRAWMRARLRSRGIDRLRAMRTAARHELAAGLLSGRVVRHDADPARMRDQSLALAQLQGLPAALRQVAQLAYLEGYTCTEISRRCGLPHGTVKSRLAAARCELQRRMRSSTPGVYADD